MMLLRSFAVQGSWNYKTLLGTGFAFALIPALRQFYAGDPEGLEAALSRHSKLFNSHPYLTPMALGGVAALEAERAEPALIERFKAALRGSLGSLGDRVVWAGWRPLCVILALVIFFAGATAWMAAVMFLIVYNAGHVALRAWAFRVGQADPRGVGAELRRSRLPTVQRLIAPAGVALLGAALPLAVVGGFSPSDSGVYAVTAVAGGGAIIGVILGARVRAPVMLLLTMFIIVGVLWKAAR